MTQNDADRDGVEQDELEAYQDKLDELHDGLLEAYAAGFAKAKEVYDISEGPDDAQLLMQTEGVSASHYYYWEGRTLPLEFWIREQFTLDSNSN